jgi:integrase
MTRRDLTPRALQRRKPVVRVIEEMTPRRVLAFWSVKGLRQYRTFPATKVGRREAQAFAEGVFARLTTPEKPPTLGTRALWTRYLEAEGHRLRPRTRAIYWAAWRKWELFVGADTIAEDVNTEAVARFRAVLAPKHAVTQVQGVIRVVKLVYAWADELELIGRNKVGRYRFRIGKDEVKYSAAEYRTAEWEAILRAMGGGQDIRNWRAWCAVLLAGSQGERINAILRLRWSDVDLERAVITWPKATNKIGNVREQPITPEGLSALLTARWWAGRLRVRGATVIPGATPRSPHYLYMSFRQVLLAAEKRAGIPHLKLRASHGFRKMAAGNVRTRTGDPLLALEWIGDKDLRMAEPYLKGRADRLEELAAPVHPPAGLPPKPATEVPRDVQHDL